MKTILGLIFVAFVLYQCTDGGLGTDKIFGPPENLPLSRYNEIDVNVYFYFPNGHEVYLGETKGASSCGSIAYSYAGEKNLLQNNEWGYVCCTIEGDASCYRKIR